MNMRNINVITALSVPGKTVSDDFMHAVRIFMKGDHSITSIEIG